VAAGSAGLQVVDVSNHAAPQRVASLALAGNANDVKLSGGRAFVAGGTAGLHIIDIGNPLAPRLIQTVDTKGEAVDVRAYGNLAFVANSALGLQIVDIGPGAPAHITGAIKTPGVPRGVDATGTIAVVAGSAGLHFVNVANPAAPVILGARSLPDDAKDVVVNGPIAYVADYTGSLQIVDFSTPAAARVVGSTTSGVGGILMDVTLSGPFVLGADVGFVNGIPIISVSLPSNPIVRAELDFPRPTYRDDNGTGIAADASYVYLTASQGIFENGVSGDTGLYIGQYRSAEDLNGVAPTVRITSPLQGATFVEGETTATSSVAAATTGIVSPSTNVAP
jgi:hypothetical protein